MGNGSSIEASKIIYVDLEGKEEKVRNYIYIYICICNLWLPYVYSVYGLQSLEGKGKKVRIYIDGFVQDRCNSSALALELRLSCTNPSIYDLHMYPINTIYMLLKEYP